MLRTLAIVFGIIFVFVGVAGFMPALAPNNFLFGLFHVNALHNLFHLGAGIIGFACGFNTPKAARLYFQIFGVVYAALALIGLYYGPAPLFGLIANNYHDVWLHGLLAIVMLYIGFGRCCRKGIKDEAHDACCRQKRVNQGDNYTNQNQSNSNYPNTNYTTNPNQQNSNYPNANYTNPNQQNINYPNANYTHPNQQNTNYTNTNPNYTNPDTDLDQGQGPGQNKNPNQTIQR